MSERPAEPADSRNLLAEFFAERREPAPSQSAFTPAQVAEIVRRDRDSSE